MNKVNWTVVAVIAVLALLALMFAVPFLGGLGYGGYGYGAWGMMGPWMMGGMFFMWIIPLAFIVLVGLGIVWMVRNLGGPGSTNIPSRRCPSCGQSVQADWKNCPHCGAELTK